MKTQSRKIRQYLILDDDISPRVLSGEYCLVGAGLPLEAKIIDLYYDPPSLGFVCKFEHSSFLSIAPGTEPPCGEVILKKLDKNDKRHVSLEDSFKGL